MIAKLAAGEREAALKELRNWQMVKDRDAIQRSFKFKNFSEAWGFMARVALLAESQDHHPEWFNVWNKVVIDLVTHSVKGISDLDFVLAEKVEEVFSGLLARQQKSGS